MLSSPERHELTSIGEFDVQNFTRFISPNSFLIPDDLVESAWHEHAPFAFWLTEALSPRVFVELGAHHGFSYFSVCQIVRKLDLGTTCYAIDTWQGDEHAGFYDESVYRSVERLSAKYAAFSTLVRSTFTSAASSFPERSVDLLHIDGRHFYEDVKADFETWLPKLTENAVVLFHDINVREGDFGVWRLWSELRRARPSFEFVHGHGLGVIAVGAPPDTLRPLFSATASEARSIRSIYARLGSNVRQRWLKQARERDLEGLSGRLDHQAAAFDAFRAERDMQSAAQAAQLAAKDAQLSDQAIRLSDQAAELVALNARLADNEAELNDKGGELDGRNEQIAELEREISILHQGAEDYRAEISRRDHAIAEKNVQLAELEGDLLRNRRSVFYRLFREIMRIERQLRGLVGRLGGRSTRHDASLRSAVDIQHPAPSPDMPLGAARRVLVADYRVPRADTSAGERATVGILRDLCAIGFEVVLLPDDLEPAPNYEAELESYGVTVITRAQGYRSTTEYINQNAHTFGLFYLIRFNIAENAIDLIRRVAPAARIIFHAPDLHFLREMREAELQDDDALRAAAGQTRRRELSVMRRADRTVLVSAAEAPFVRAYLPEAPISVFQALYASIQDSPAGFADRANLLFLGGFGHPPNKDAVHWFVAEIWPRVRSRLPDAEFHIVGAEAPDSVRRLETVAGVKVVGFAPDLERVLSSYRVGVAPLRYGAGIKGKVGMMMGAGMPCVCTSIAVEGMHIEGGVHGEVFDDPEQFADAIVRVYTDPELWGKYSAGGQSVIAEHFGDAANRASLLSVLNETGALPVDVFIDYCEQVAPRALPMVPPGRALDVSIIIPAYNQWPFTRKCLNSILETTVGTGITFEILLADDGSTDQTVHAERFYPGLRVIKTEKNVGFLRNCNNAAAYAEGKFLLFLNNDTVVLPRWLDGLVTALEEDSSVAIVGSKLLYPDATIQDAGATLFKDGAAVHIGRGHDRYAPIFNVERECDYVSGASILVRSSFWRDVGGFDERYKDAGCEDSDLAMSARARGFRVVYQPRSEVVHFEHQSYSAQGANQSRLPQNNNLAVLRDKWRDQLAIDHHDALVSWPLAMSRADRTASASAVVRRREGRLNILYFSPFASHPSNHGNRATINQFAGRFQAMGHRVHFALLEVEECTAADIKAMRAAWDTLDLLPCNRAQRVPDVGNIPYDGWYPDGLGETIRCLCSRYDIDIVFCSYVFHSKLLEFVPDHTLKVIDTHDMMSDRYEMLRLNGQAREFFSCSSTDEGAYLRRADVVIARREEEARYFDQATGSDGALVIPHMESPRFLDKTFDRVASVGIVASPNRINLAILRQCLEAIDQHLQGARCPFVVDVAGQVRDMVNDLPTSEKSIFRRPWVRLRGFVPDLQEFYASMDLMLSPVTMGTGINVKTVQAMAHGMPLLSTRHGAKGIESGDPMHSHDDLASLVESLFTIADQPAELRRLAALSRETYVRFYDDGQKVMNGLFLHPKMTG